MIFCFKTQDNAKTNLVIISVPVCVGGRVVCNKESVIRCVCVCMYVCMCVSRCVCEFPVNNFLWIWMQWFLSCRDCFNFHLNYSQEKHWRKIKSKMKKKMQILPFSVIIFQEHLKLFNKQHFRSCNFELQSHFINHKCNSFIE